MWYGLAFRGLLGIAGTWWIFSSSRDYITATPEERDYIHENPLKWLGSGLLDKGAKTALVPLMTILMYMGYATQRSLIEISDTAYREIAEEEADIEYGKTYLAYPSIWLLEGMAFDFEPRFFEAKLCKWEFANIEATLLSKGTFTNWVLQDRPQENDFTDTMWRVSTYTHVNYSSLIGTDEEYFVGTSNFNQQTRTWNAQSHQVYARSVLVGDRYFARFGTDLASIIAGPRVWSFNATSGSIVNTTSEQHGNHPVYLDPPFDPNPYERDWEIVGCDTNPWIRFVRGTAQNYYPDDLSSLTFSLRFEHWNVVGAET